MSPDPDAFAVHHAEVRGGDLAYLREGEGGFPLLLLHGWPETKRIWWRNVRPLADAGFEVIVPDLRGFGDSGEAPDGFYDFAAHARDMHALATEVLGHDRAVACGGDIGGIVAQVMALQFPDLVRRLVLFNTVPPFIPETYEAAGAPPDLWGESSQARDYFVRQAYDADGLAEELDTPEKRRRWVAGMYGHRFWATPGAFTAEDVDFMSEPFGDPSSFRASIANYESIAGQRAVSEEPRFAEPVATPALVLYGPDDHVIPPSFKAMARVAYPERVGPLVVEDAGHFLQWEQAALLNQAVRYFCLDLLAEAKAG